MGGGLESRCVGRVYGADGAVRRQVIGSSQRPLPDNTQHLQQTIIHASGGIRTQISAGERPQTYALDRAATGTGGLIVAVGKAVGT